MLDASACSSEVLNLKNPREPQAAGRDEAQDAGRDEPQAAGRDEPEAGVRDEPQVATREGPQAAAQARIQEPGNIHVKYVIERRSMLENKFYFPSIYSIPLFAVEKCHMAYAIREIPPRTFIDPLFRAVPRLPDDGVCSIVFDSLFSSTPLASCCFLLPR